MSNFIESNCYVLGDDIDTDQIIPARHLSLSLEDPEQRAQYGGFALSGVPQKANSSADDTIPFSDPQTQKSPFKIIIAGKNFGCGSSREHALVALAEAGVQVIIARSYSRIFFRNAIDGGYFPPYQCDVDLHKMLKTGDSVRFDKSRKRLTVLESGAEFQMQSLGAAESILENGGIFGYARKLSLVNTLEKKRVETS